MTHYDHAVAMAYKLDQWGADRPLRRFEQEALAAEQRDVNRYLEKTKNKWEISKFPLNSRTTFRHQFYRWLNHRRMR